MKKVIGILCPSRSGSTLFELTLGSLAGVAAIGESYHLVNPQSVYGDGVRLDSLCSSCGAGCPVLTRDLVVDIQWSNLYDRLLEAHSVDTLVDSNKSIDSYNKALAKWGGVFQPLIVFKNPFEYACSALRAFRREGNGVGVVEILNTWAYFYESAIEFSIRIARPNEPVFVEYGRFCDYQYKTLNLLCRSLDLPFNPDSLRYWNFPHHRCGGNSGTFISVWGKDNHRTDHKLGQDDAAGFYTDNFRQVVRDERWKTYLTVDEKNRVRNHTMAWNLYTSLVKRGLK